MTARNKTAHEVADALAVARTSVYEWMKCGCPHDEAPDPAARGGKTYKLSVDEVQQWRATRVHGNTQAIRAPKAAPTSPSQRTQYHARLIKILEDNEVTVPSVYRDRFITHLNTIVDELIDTQEAIATEALKQIATTKRAANELVARRSNANDL
jgi:hypothetical protein